MAEWWLYGRKIARAPFGGTWQPRRNGSLKDCAEEMMASNLEFDAFFISFGTAVAHERPRD